MKTGSGPVGIKMCTRNVGEALFHIIFVVGGAGGAGAVGGHGRGGRRHGDHRGGARRHQQEGEQQETKEEKDSGTVHAGTSCLLCSGGPYGAVLSHSS